MGSWLCPGGIRGSVQMGLCSVQMGSGSVQIGSWLCPDGIRLCPDGIMALSRWDHGSVQLGTGSVQTGSGCVPMCVEELASGKQIFILCYYWLFCFTFNDISICHIG
jgi:hypothetical protein